MLRRQKRSPEVVARDQLKASLIRSIHQINPESIIQNDEQLIGKVLNIPNQWLKGKNMDILAGALLAIGQGHISDPNAFNLIISSFTKPEDVNNFKQEVLAYIFFLSQINETPLLSSLPDWRDTWTPINLIE